jgi:hypothetical protein
VMARPILVRSNSIGAKKLANGERRTFRHPLQLPCDCGCPDKHGVGNPSIARNASFPVATSKQDIESDACCQ